jgi:hypothetical protein
MSAVTIYHTSLSAFIPLIKKSLLDTEGTKSVSSACKALLRNVSNYYASSFTRSDRAFFSFLIAAEYAKTFEPNNEKLKIKDIHWYFFLNGELHPKYVTQV